MTHDDDHALLARVAARDRRAFEILYRRYYRRLFGYLLKVTRRVEIVDEVLDDVMLVVWEKAHRFDGRSRPSSWILGIAYRKALKALSRLPAEASLPEPEDAVDPDGPERAAVERQVATTLDRALGEISPEQRAVVELTYYGGYSYREIAAIVGCPVNTVKTRMFHARRRLRELLPALGIHNSAELEG